MTKPLKESSLDTSSEEALYQELCLCLNVQDPTCCFADRLDLIIEYAIDEEVEAGELINQLRDDFLIENLTDRIR